VLAGAVLLRLGGRIPDPLRDFGRWLWQLSTQV